MGFKKIILFFVLIIASLSLSAFEPIDVVIPATRKDLVSLEACINGIKSSCQQIRRIIVVSSEAFTKKAEWFDENKFPFSKADIAFYLNQGDAAAAADYLNESRSRAGWYFQQLLKLYAPFVIPGISSNVLVLDADTIFLRPVKFIDSEGNALYNPGTEYHKFYFEHFEKMLPGYKKIYPQYSGISHHMLFQKEILERLFATVEEFHEQPFWKIFCLMVDKEQLRAAGASEYEIYFNFVFANSAKVKIRELRWTNTLSFDIIGKKGLAGFAWRMFDYVSCHKYD